MPAYKYFETSFSETVVNIKQTLQCKDCRT